MDLPNLKTLFCFSTHLVPLDFEILADKICDLFPNENKATYYIPRVPGNKKKSPLNAKGKLVDKYRNLRRMYKLCTSTSVSDDDSAETTKTHIENGRLVSIS